MEIGSLVTNDPKEVDSIIQHIVSRSFIVPKESHPNLSSPSHRTAKLVGKGFVQVFESEIVSDSKPITDIREKLKKNIFTILDGFIV